MRARRLRRPLAITGAAGLLVGAAATLGAGPLRVLPVAALNCPQPSISHVGISTDPSPPSSQHGPRGSTVVITGSGLNTPTLCGTTDTITIGSASFNIDASKGTATSQSFTLNQAADGPVVLRNSDGLKATGPTFVTDPAPVALPATPTVGEALTASGSGLDLGGQLASAVVQWSVNAGRCPGSTASVASGGGSVTVPALGAYCNGTATLVLAWNGNNGNTVAVPAGSVVVAPTVSGVSPAEAPAGSSVTVQGTGFGSAGSATVAGAQAASSWTDTAVTVALPDGAAGGDVALTRADGVAIDGGSVVEDARIDSVSPASAPPGATVTISGGGFGAGPGTLSLGSTQLTPASWSPTTVTFQVPPGAAAGNLTLKPASGGAASAALGVAATLAGVSPDHGTAGTLVQLSGSGFGTSQGTVSIAGRPASVSLWGDSSVVVAVPDGAPAGATTISIKPQGQPALSTAFTVDPGKAAPTPGQTIPGAPGTSSSSSSASSSTTSYNAPTFIAPSADGPIISTSPVQFQKPPAATGPVTLTMTPGEDSGDPGQTVPLDVVLVAFGKPVSGAKVHFVMVVEPGKDASISPAETVTDAAGHAHATLHLSGTAGDHIVLATSGQFSDEVRVVGRGADSGAVAAVGGAGRGQDVISTVTGGPSRLLVLGALLFCILLFVAGTLIQIFVPRSRGADTVVAADGTVILASRRRLTPFVVAEGFVTLLQYAGVAALVALALPPARLLQRLTGRG